MSIVDDASNQSERAIFMAGKTLAPHLKLAGNAHHR